MIFASNTKAIKVPSSINTPKNLVIHNDCPVTCKESDNTYSVFLFFKVLALHITVGLTDSRFLMCLHVCDWLQGFYGEERAGMFLTVLMAINEDVCVGWKVSGVCVCVWIIFARKAVNLYAFIVAYVHSSVHLWTCKLCVLCARLMFMVLQRSRCEDLLVGDTHHKSKSFN